MDLVRDLNRRVDARTLSTADARRGAEALRDLDQVLGVLPEAQALPKVRPELLEERAAARTAKRLGEVGRAARPAGGDGREVEDSRDGQRWRLTRKVSSG